MRLLQSQKNELFEMIQNSDYFMPNNFEMEEGGQHKLSTSIIFENRNFQFSMSRSETYQTTIYINHWPGNDKFQDIHAAENWAQCKAYFNNWLIYLQREITAPNLWERFQNSIKDIQLSSQNNNSKFSHNEYLELSVKMSQLIDVIPDLKLIESQTKVIQLELHNLLEKASELGKFDWRNLFIGTIISIVIQLNVNQENAVALWDLIKGIFNNYFLPQ